MSEKFLMRDDAPFGDKVWELIDRIVAKSAEAELSARRVLATIGPYGLGFKSLPSGESPLERDSDEETSVTADCSIPVPLISTSFTISARDIDTYERYGLPMNMRNVVQAAQRCARKEDRLLYYGSQSLGSKGLLNSDGVQSVSLKEWKQVGDGVHDVMKAIEKLDNAGHHGPYILALDPARYTALFERYPQGNVLEIDHMRQMLGGNVVKAASVDRGGVLLAEGMQYASIMLGQDIMTAFEGPEGRNYTFILSESLALRLNVPSAVCRLQASGKTP
ncbi:MAG: DUF2184 domain-containing protein [Chitinivibrionales bacterium]|nr:DUF2184 domain-containing protein [Chitinivibrionales bacterium]